MTDGAGIVGKQCQTIGGSGVDIKIFDRMSVAIKMARIGLATGNRIPADRRGGGGGGATKRRQINIGCENGIGQHVATIDIVAEPIQFHWSIYHEIGQSVLGHYGIGHRVSIIGKVGIKRIDRKTAVINMTVAIALALGWRNDKTIISGGDRSGKH